MDVAIDITDIVIETERLILRAFRDSDLDDFYAYASVPGVGEAAGWKHHESIAETQKILAIFINHKNAFALYDKSDGKVIGSLGLHESWANDDEAYKQYKTKEIGYVLSKDYWGRGLMPEAVRAVIDYGFRTLGIEAFTCGHFISNDKSRRVIEKCGFKFVKKSEFVATTLQKTFEDMTYILFAPDIIVQA